MTEPTAGTSPVLTSGGLPSVSMDVSPEIAFKTALGHPLVPKLYVNQFSIVIQPADVALLLGLAGQPTGIISMSYPLAKAFATRLLEALVGYETNSQSKVPALETLESNLRNSTQKP